ncbi:peptidoglycan-binding protein [Bradyrhizobium sp. 2S1]|uniref:peptidoglycan-binding protein n=1 Tax=Bradyrhizobium sp. 2S1 TaxID=1404429 RepID=UPI001CD122B8|nr:peptidoglycan-binding protein [Bradyrhizobium sp. 2S1]MCK7670154.1 peptidoglycan-binding protein [Bradyrhizobium sp. 2S1]
MTNAVISASAIDLHGISRAAFDLIVAAEVTSEAWYSKHLRWPTWPGEQSGVTIGCGYDVGQATRQQFLADWSGKIPDAMLKALAKCCGVTGQAAAALARQLRGVVDIPWDVALEVFANHDIPRYLAICRRLLPGFDELSPDCKGVVLSIAFNRDAGGFNKPGTRWTEMRQIKAAIGSGELAKIPGLIRSMKRLWPDSRGLRIRRDDEAALFEHGLATSHPQEHAKLATTPAPVDPDVVAHVQARLRELGYYDVGQVDGEQSPQGRTEGMVLAYRNARGLPLTPAIDDQLIAELGKPQAPRQVAETRAAATVEDPRRGLADDRADRSGQGVGRQDLRRLERPRHSRRARLGDRSRDAGLGGKGSGRRPRPDAWRGPGDRDRPRRPGRRRRRRRPGLVCGRHARAAPPG